MSSNKNNILLVNERDNSAVVVIENEGAPYLIDEDDIKPAPNIQVNEGARIFKEFKDLDTLLYRRSLRNKKRVDYSAFFTYELCKVIYNLITYMTSAKNETYTLWEVMKELD